MERLFLLQKINLLLFGKKINILIKNFIFTFSNKGSVPNLTVKFVVVIIVSAFLDSFCHGSIRTLLSQIKQIKTTFPSFLMYLNMFYSPCSVGFAGAAVTSF